MGGTVEIVGARGPMPVYVAEPLGQGPTAGVLVISDALGMTSDLRAHAEWLAENGFLAAAPDLFHWGGRLRCLFAVMRQALAREGDVFDDLEATRVWLRDHERSTGAVGVIGFCLGGGFAVTLAGSGGFDVSAVNYGDVPGDAAQLLADACPIVGSFGGRDPTLRTAPRDLRVTLDALGIANDIHTYPDAGHGFMNDHPPDEIPPWAAVTARVSNTAYDPAATADARRRILGFFHEHLAA